MKPYGWIGFAVVYVAYTIAFLLGEKNPMGQLNAAFGALGGLLFISIMAANLTFNKSSPEHGRFGEKFGWALHSIVFSVSAELTALIFVFYLFGALFIFLKDNPVLLVSEGFYLPITYFALSIDNRFFSFLISKSKLVILALGAAFLLSLAAITFYQNPNAFFLIALSGAPIAYWVVNKEIPKELNRKGHTAQLIDEGKWP